MKRIKDLYKKLSDVKKEIDAKNNFIQILNKPIEELISKTKKPDEVQKKVLQEIHKIGNTLPTDLILEKTNELLSIR